MMKRSIPGAVVSTDPAFRETVRAVLSDAERKIAVQTEITVPFSGIDAQQLQALRDAEPKLVFLDLEEDPATGIRLAQFLTEAQPGRRFIAAGPTLSSDLLMAAMRAGISEYLPKPVAPEGLAEALRRMERLLGVSSNGAGPQKPGEVIAVFSAKGGSGSTTVATNLAIHLQRLSAKRTLLLDLDLELGEIAVLLGMQPRFNFVDMVRNFHRMDAELLASYIEKHESGVHLLSAPFHPDKAETVPGDAIRKILQFLRQHYDYIVVDTSKSFAPATLATIEQADQVMLVTTVDLPSLRNVKRCMPVIDRLAAGRTDKVRLVVNRYNPNDVISLDEVRTTLGMDVYWTLANDYEAVSRSINSGQPVILNERSGFARDLRAMGADMAGLGVQGNGRRKPLESLRKLFSRNQEALAHG